MIWLRRPLQRAVPIGAALAVVVASGAASQELRRFDFEAPAMGTRFRVSLYSADQDAAKAAADAAFERIRFLNTLFSDYEPESEVMRLCAAAPNAVPVSAELHDVLRRSKELSEWTDGAFDVTAGPLTRLWRRSRSSGALPAADRLRLGLQLTNWRRIELGEEPRTVRLTQERMVIDLGGIAKGRAADEALRLLRHRGFPAAIVQAGGDTAVGAPPPGEAGWEVKIRTFESPEAPKERLLTLVLAHCGLSTSGDLYQSMVVGGKKYSHIISPKTGLGLTHSIACSVIATDTTTSDAMATAMCVLGVERGLQVVAAHPGLHARFAWQEGKNVHVQTSPQFPARDASH